MMELDVRTLRTAAGAIALACGVAACDTPNQTEVELDPSAAVTGWERTAFDVYSQNLYLGGSTAPRFNPAVIANDSALLAAVQDFWEDVQASDVTERMGEIADEIALRNPEVVGLQEAFQFVAVDFVGGGPPVVIDFLRALEAQIAARGLPYELVIEQEATSSQLPLDAVMTEGGLQFTAVLMFTDRIAILRRTDVNVTGTASDKYAAFVPVIPNQVHVERAWARASVDHDGQTHHFVTTHLEVQALRPINEAQGAELIGIVTGLEGVTIVAGDLNSDAAATEGAPSYTLTYENFLAAGFADMWDLAPRSRREPGYTCCQADDLRNTTSELDERIDFVLVRSSEGPIPGADNRRGHFRMDVVGDRPSDMTAGGLWPSDHAGLAGSIRNADGTDD